MKRTDALVLKVFLYGLPLVVALAIAASYVERVKANSSALSIAYDFAGFVFLFWIAFSLYLCARLLLSADFRTETLSRLSFIRERDERESFLTGRAVKNTFLSMLAILIVALCLSIFTVTVEKVPPGQAEEGKRGSIRLGAQFSFFEPGAMVAQADPDVSAFKYAYNGVPISKTGLILLLILWQIATYNFSMRRLDRIK